MNHHNPSPLLFVHVRVVVYYELSWKESIDSDGQYFLQYQQDERTPQIIEHKKTRLM
jgi:hypothetical protein